MVVFNKETHGVIPHPFLTVLPALYRNEANYTQQVARPFNITVAWWRQLREPRVPYVSQQACPDITCPCCCDGRRIINDAKVANTWLACTTAVVHCQIEAAGNG